MQTGGVPYPPPDVAVETPFLFEYPSLLLSATSKLSEEGGTSREEGGTSRERKPTQPTPNGLSMMHVCSRS